MPPTSRGEFTAAVPDMALSNTILPAAPALVATSTSTAVTVMAPHDNDGIIQHHTSKVNGLGMWAAWERNFSNKLKACLDLVDNAVDAALWDSDDEDDDSDDDDDDNDDNNSKSEEGKQSNKKSPLTREEKWKKVSGNIQITTERHRLASAAAAAAAVGEESSDNNDDDDDSPPVIVHDILGKYSGKKRRSSNNNSSGNGNGNGNGNSNVNSNDDYDYILDDDNTLCLHNDCVYPVKKLKKILDVYNSDKSDSAIGENGVGVKQAAAAMSDLSIVVTTRIDQEPLLEKKNDDGNDDGDIINNSNNKDSSSSTPSPRIRKCLVSIGILSKQLQTPGAVVIPNWEIKVEFRVDENHNAGQKEEGVDCNDNNEEEAKKKEGNNKTDDNDHDGKVADEQDCRSVLIREIATITAKFTGMGKAMKQFGGAAPTNRRMHGIRRLAKHVELMISSNYKKSNKKSNTKKQKPPHPHQFLMLLHRFGKNEVKKRTNENKEVSDALSIKARNSLDDLLQDLADELPKTYLHIPPAPYFKIKVNSETLKFQYWERQLVELHRIPLLIDRTNDFRSAEDWLGPTSEDDCYDVQVTIGFDPTRANPLRGGGMTRSLVENTFIGGQACSLLIYSRVSGRLFLKHDDARGILRLNNSGTHYCQGLTVIVDDLAGNLPLTPTKESLAFGLEEHGTIHERNLYAWLGALANLYWTHFYNKFKTKGALGEAIKSKVNRVNELEREHATNLPSLKDGSFSTVQRIGFSRERIQGSIRPCKSNDIVWINGPDTLIKLGGPARPKPKKTQPKKTTTAATAEKRRLSTTLSVMDGYDSDGNDLMTGKPPSEGEEIPPRERLDGRPVRSTIKPQRFDEIHDEHSPRKKRFKTSGQGNGDASLKKKLEEVQRELEGTYAELNASKATCDDLQMLLEEREQMGSVERKKINELKNELNQTEKKHEAELQRIRVEHAKNVDEMRA